MLAIGSSGYRKNQDLRVLLRNVPLILNVLRAVSGEQSAHGTPGSSTFSQRSSLRFTISPSLARLKLMKTWENSLTLHRYCSSPRDPSTARRDRSTAPSLPAERDRSCSLKGCDLFQKVRRDRASAMQEQFRGNAFQQHCYCKLSGGPSTAPSRCSALLRMTGINFFYSA